MSPKAYRERVAGIEGAEAFLRGVGFGEETAMHQEEETAFWVGGVFFYRYNIQLFGIFLQYFLFVKKYFYNIFLQIPVSWIFYRYNSQCT